MNLPWWGDLAKERFMAKIQWPSYNDPLPIETYRFNSLPPSLVNIAENAIKDLMESSHPGVQIVYEFGEGIVVRWGKNDFPGPRGPEYGAIYAWLEGFPKEIIEGYAGGLCD